MSERDRCEVAVYHRDTYRYTGRAKGGFEMHYTMDQCKRAAVVCAIDGDRRRTCRQHWGYLGYGLVPWRPFAPPAGAEERE